MGNLRRSCVGYPYGLRDAAGWSVTCSSSSSSLGYCSLFGDAFSKCKVSQSFGIVSADASLQPLSIAKQSPCFNGQVPPCSGRCDPSAGVFGLRRSVRCAPFSGMSADLRAGGSLSGSWSLNGRLWTKVCTCIRSEQSSSVPCVSSRCCTLVLAHLLCLALSLPFHLFLRCPLMVLVVLGWALGWVFHGWGGRWACLLSLRF